MCTTSCLTLYNLKQKGGEVTLYQDHQEYLIPYRTSLLVSPFFKSGRRFASSRCEHVFDLHWPYARNRTRTRRNMLCPCLFSLRSFWRWVQASYLVLRFVNLWRVGSKSFRVCPCNILQPLESGGCVELPPCLQVTLIGCQKAPRAPCRALVGRLRRKQLPEVSPVESQFFR